MDNLREKSVDAVIMTYMPSHRFVLLVESLFNQSYNINKIHIINTEENYLFLNLEEKDKIKLKSLLDNEKINLINITKNSFDHGASRNLIINYSSADYIVFFTNDAIPYDENLIKELVEGMCKDSKIKVSYARQIPYDDAFYKEKLTREFNYPDYDILKSLETNEMYGIKNYFLSNVCAIYDFNYFMENKGFVEDIILNEDMYYAYNVINNGYKVFYNSKAKVFHSHNYSYIKQFKRYFDIGVSHNKDSKILKNISPKKEGKKLFIYVLSNMLKNKKITSLIDFVFDICFRYMGYIIGKNYKLLNNNICVRLSMNKNYFLKDHN